MKGLVRGLARDISQGLVSEIQTQRTTVQQSSKDSVVDMLLQQLAAEVVRQLKAEPRQVVSADALEARLRRLEGRLRKLTHAGRDVDDDDDDDDDDEIHGTGSAFPNLKYAKSKYKDVDSVLKYIDSDDTNGGFKLVIMNFND